MAWHNWYFSIVDAVVSSVENVFDPPHPHRGGHMVKRLCAKFITSFSVTGCFGYI